MTIAQRFSAGMSSVMSSSPRSGRVNIKNISRPFHGLRSHRRSVPPMNRWAILNRPLRDSRALSRLRSACCLKSLDSSWLLLRRLVSLLCCFVALLRSFVAQLDCFHAKVRGIEALLGHFVDELNHFVAKPRGFDALLRCFVALLRSFTALLQYFVG